MHVDQGGDASPTAMQIDFAESLHGKATANGNLRAGSTSVTPPATYQSKPGETTRTLLQRIAQTAEEAIRTAEEKVSIAQTAYESVRDLVLFPVSLYHSSVHEIGRPPYPPSRPSY